MLLNMLSKAVNAKPDANIDFIFTNDKSRLLFLSFSSSRSIFFLCCLSNESPNVSFRFSTNGQNTNYVLNTIKFSPKIMPFIMNFDIITVKTYIFCFVFQFQSLVFEIYRFYKLEATSILEGQHKLKRKTL